MVEFEQSFADDAVILAHDHARSVYAYGRGATEAEALADLERRIEQDRENSPGALLRKSAEAAMAMRGTS